MNGGGLHLVPVERPAAVGVPPDPTTYQARCIEAYQASQVARGFSPLTIGNGTGTLERFLAACGRPAWEVTLDPHTATALRRVLTDRHASRDDNPHLFVNQKTKTIAGPVSRDYLTKLLAPAGVTPLRLRATRLAELVTTMDPILVAHAYGIRHGAVLHYLADTVNPTRLTPEAPSNL